MSTPEPPADPLATRFLPFIPPLALVYAHLRGLASAWSGASWFGCDLGLDRCDVLYTLSLSHAVLAHLGDAWAAGPLDFVLRGFWQVPLDTRTLNILDVIVGMGPLRALLPIGPTLLLLHLGLLLTAIGAGYLFARDLGASRVAATAASVVTGTSGVVLTCVSQAQYPQAILPVFLAFFAGLARLYAGRKGGIALTASAAVIALLLYWLNALLLFWGALAWCAGAILGRLPRSSRWVWDLALVGLLVGLACLPAALPLLAAFGTGTESKMAIPTGTTAVGDLASTLAVLDAVPLRSLLSPQAGWILPVLPLAPALVFAFAHRRQAPWILLLILAALLLPGPVLMPGLYEGAIALNTLNISDMFKNPVYGFAHNWIPLMARMYHPLRWGALASTALAMLVATGVDGGRAHWPRATSALVVLGVAWATWVGPWPLTLRPFPGSVERVLGTCTEVVFTPLRPGGVGRTPGDGWLLEGLARRPFLPVYVDPDQGMAPPVPSVLEASQRRRTQVEDLIAGGARGDWAPGICIVLDTGTSSLPVDSVRAAVQPISVGSEVLVLPARTFHGQSAPITWEIFRTP